MSIGTMKSTAERTMNQSLMGMSSAGGENMTVGGRGQGGKYLTFKLDQEEYGLEILRVREIIGLMRITAVPQMPHYVKGVINLRGKVIPVVDLRLKFGFPEIEPTEQSCVIVVDVGREIGIIVDTVSEVLSIAESNVDPAPPMGEGADTSFILGMGKVGDSVKILLDIGRVLSGDDAALAEAMATRMAPA